jgi:serine/threonine protein kinase
MTNGQDPVRIGGRYELSGLLGRGGMAEVRKGTDVRLGRVVAVKRLRTDLASDPTFQARFRREAQSAASLNHPAIVAVYDTGEEMSTDGTDVAQPYIVMEYVAGRTLREILREGRKILPERALEITSGVLSALDYSHRAGTAAASVVARSSPSRPGTPARRQTPLRSAYRSLIWFSVSSSQVGCSCCFAVTSAGGKSSSLPSSSGSSLTMASSTPFTGEM